MTVKDQKVTSKICKLKKLIMMIFIEKCTKKKGKLFSSSNKQSNVPAQENSTE